MREVDPAGWHLLVLGLFLLAGYLAHVLGRKAHVPRVTLLLLLGVLAGPSVLDLVPHAVEQWFGLAAQLALSVVGFLLGERFFVKTLRETGRLVLFVALAETIGAVVVVFALLTLVGVPTVFALLLAGVSATSAPAASVDVVRELRAKGAVSSTVLGVVALDDAFGIIVFNVVLVVAQALDGGGAGWSLLAHGAWELLGAVLIGSVVGFPMAYLTGRVRPGELTLIEALGFVLACSGLASIAGASYLLSCIVLGVIVANRARHHHRPFHAIERISQPFLIVFFLLAGFELDFKALGLLGVTAAVYVVGRSGGKLLGSYVGARLANAPATVRRYAGLCLLPQAGVALGLGLLAAQRFPDYGPQLLSLLVGTTFLFEVVGPIAARVALLHAKEARSPR